VIIQSNYAPSAVPKTTNVGELISGVTHSLSALLERHGLSADAIAALRVHLDWIQYKTSFREPAILRRSVDRDGRPLPLTELAIDLRQIDPARLDEQLAVPVQQLKAGTDADAVDGRVYLDEFKPWRNSLLWPFNRLFWRKLDMWEKHANRGYEAALPSGGSDSTNPDAVASRPRVAPPAAVRDLRDGAGRRLRCARAPLARQVQVGRR
jgi:hypothetical protein